MRERAKIGCMSHKGAPRRRSPLLTGAPFRLIVLPGAKMILTVRSTTVRVWLHDDKLSSLVWLICRQRFGSRQTAARNHCHQRLLLSSLLTKPTVPWE